MNKIKILNIKFKHRKIIEQDLPENVMTSLNFELEDVEINVEYKENLNIFGFILESFDVVGSITVEYKEQEYEVIKDIVKKMGYSKWEK